MCVWIILDLFNKNSLKSILLQSQAGFMKSWYDGSLSGLFFFFSFPWETAFGVEEIMMSFSQVSIPAKISHATPHAQELSLRERHCQTCLMCHCAQSNTTLSIFWVIFCILHVGVHFIVCLFIPLLPHVYVFLCLKWWLINWWFQVQ